LACGSVTSNRTAKAAKPVDGIGSHFVADLNPAPHRSNPSVLEVACGVRPVSR
jgi:hypothetical protein